MAPYNTGIVHVVITADPGFSSYNTGIDYVVIMSDNGVSPGHCNRLCCGMLHTILMFPFGGWVGHEQKIKKNI